MSFRNSAILRLMSDQQFEKLNTKIDNLADAVADGFSHLEKRITSVETSLNERITSLETSVNERFASVNKQFGSVNERLDAQSQEIKALRRDLAQVPDEIDETYAKVLNELVDRVGVLEKKFEMVK